jgi:Fe-S-cluster containining protein
MSLAKSEEGTKEWEFLTVRSTGWVEFGDKTARWFVIPQPCPKFKDGRCTIYETRPVVCKDYPEAARFGSIWETKCEVLRKRRNE